MEGEVTVSESSGPSEAVSTPTTETSHVSHETAPHETETSQETSGERPQGFDRVEFTPEQKARVDRLYGNMKRYETDSKELREQNHALMRSLEQLYQGQTQIVSHLQTTDYQDAESRLNGERDQAWKTGDLQGYHKANDSLVEIRARKITAENMARQQPRPQQVNNVTRPTGGDLSPVESNIAQSWINETDATGNLKRAWTQTHHPKNQAAAFQAQAVFADPDFSNKPMADKLKEIDKRMGMQNQTAATGQNVLGAGNLTKGNRANNIKLTDVERTIAVRTKFGGSKAKSDDDHAQAYLQAKIKSQPKGATR